MQTSAKAPVAPVPKPAAQSIGWLPLLTALLIAMAMIAIMTTTYVWSQHGVVAHNLPWGQVGSSSMTAKVQKKISLDVHQYPNQSDMEQAATETKIYGGFVASSNTLVISEAASLWAPGPMAAAYEEAAKAAGQKLQVKVVNKLPPMDPEGAVPGLCLFALLVAGYLAAALVLGRTRRAAGHRRVAIMFGYSVVTALVVNLITGPGFGAYPDIRSNFWPLWGEFAFIILAVMLFASVLQYLIGPLGTLVTVITIIFFGSPSTGGVNGVAYLPPFWQAIGVFLPPRNGLLLIRNTLYFKGNALTVPVIVLGTYVVVGVVLVTLFSWKRLDWWQRGKKTTSAAQLGVVGPEEAIATSAIPAG
jgi:hypothetical protein